jgi:hypothetical protein
LPFSLEVYEPGSDENVLDAIHSSKPFPPFAVGNLLQSDALRDTGRWPDEVLQIVAIQHVLWRGPEDDYRHKLMLYTRVVANSWETIFGDDEDPKSLHSSKA